MKNKLLVLILAAMITASIAACSDGDVIKKTGTDSTGVSVTQTAATEAATQKAAQTNSSAAEVVTTVNTYANGELNGSENELAAAENNVSGVKDIYMIFSGDCEFDSWSFS